MDRRGWLSGTGAGWVRRLALAVLLMSSRAWSAGDPAPGAANAQTLKLPDGPGSVRGLADSPNVEVFSGQVGYGVPLELPAGVAGFGPSLSLGYSGDLGNGPLGVGWALPQVALRRGLRLGVPAYTAADELELVGVGGGGRLVALADGTWRVEGRAQAVKVARDGDGYVVTENGGVRYRLGITASGRQAEGTRVAAWHAEEVVHPNGQAITFSYLQHNGQQYPQYVTWGPNGAFRVEFVYTSRPDVTVSYRTGFRVETARRLSEVRVNAFGELLRVYVLGYDDSLPLSRLRTVRMLGRGREGALPTLTFSHAPAVAPGSAVRVEPAAGWMLNTPSDTTLLDVDGDGMVDLLRLTTSGHLWRKGLGSGFAAAQPLTGAAAASLSTSRLLDVDGDARPELVRSFSGAWQLNAMQGTSFGATAPWQGTDNLSLFDSTFFFADLNGDRRVDVVRSSNDSLGVRWNRGTGLSAPVSRPAVDGVALLLGPNVRFHEVNGDGLADVVQLTTSYYKVYLGKGDGTFVALPSLPYPWGDATPANVRLADLNRDGLMDLVHVLGGYVSWYPGRSGGGVEATARRLAYPGQDGTTTVVTLADLNGNGSEDVVWSGPDGMWALDLAGATTAGMLVGIDNGMGKSVSISYEGSARLAVADELAGQPWTRKLPTSIPVPVRVEMNPGAGEPARVLEYAVRDGFWDGVERRFGGFLVGSVKTLGATLADTLSEETRYHAGTGNDRVLRGVALEATQRDGLGTLYTRTLSTYEARPVAGLPDVPLLRKPALLETRTESHEGIASPLVTRTTYTYDLHVRPVEQKDEGRLDLTGDERTLQRAYASDDTLWVRDVVCEEKLLEADGTLVSHSRTFYGDATQVFTWTDPAQCRAGRLVRETHGWLEDAQSPRWVLQEATEYDAWDNPTRRYTQGVWRTLGHDANHLRVTSESTSPAPGRTLTWTMEWDDVLGSARKLTDPNGVVTEVTYDSLARPVAVAIAGASPHVRYAYDWSAPQPKTYAYTFDGAPEALAGSWTGGWVQGGRWRESVSVTNGAGEPLYSATRLSQTRWTVSDWRERDARGQVVFVAEAFFADGALPTARPPAAVGQTLTHDALGRLVRQTLPTGGFKTLSYKAFEVTESMSELVPVLRRMDGLGRPLRTERQVGSTVESVDATHDAADRIRSLRLQNGAVTHAFTYDTLGRLVSAQDPDIGPRTLRHDDGNRLTHHTNGANQVRQLFYDDVGRLTRTLGEDGTAFVYHYDLNEDGTTTGNVMGRLAWVEEPRGKVHLAYDAAGRRLRHRRSIDAHEAEESVVYSPSGLVLGSDVDGASIPMEYDAAGRAIRVGTYWEALELDAAGRVLEERYGNGVRQLYTRDEQGLPSRVRALRPTGTPLYDVTVGRTAYRAPSTLRDTDGVGLNHSARFTYDGAARLTDAILGAVMLPDDTLGEGPESSRFGYRYDGLQNMVLRQATGPQALKVLAGTYHYGERGFGPRQLTRVASASGDTLLDYDTAGRVVRQGDREMTYNGLDQLVRVTLPGTGPTTVEHAYGHDGQRVLTRGPDGLTQYWFSPLLTLRPEGSRDRYVKLGERTLARVSYTLGSGVEGPASRTGPGAGSQASLDAAGGPGLGGRVLGGLGAMLLAVLALGGSSGARWRRWAAGSLAVALVGWACNPISQTSHLTARKQAQWQKVGTLYFQAGVSAGPALITREDGSVHEERRYEPFGAPIDAYREFVGGASAVGEVDHRAEPLNALNRLTDAHTGWSDHGVRWLAPETGRWLTPDPPVKAPEPAFLSAPWDLHPYQYVRQNPIVYWDPDGQAAADAADWWEKNGRQAYREWLLTQIKPDNTFGQNLDLALLTLSVESGAGMVDLARLGEGAAQGGWRGYLQDGLRALGIATMARSAAGSLTAPRPPSALTPVSGKGLGPAGASAGKAGKPGAMTPQHTANSCGPACGSQLLREAGLDVFQSNLTSGFFRGMTPETLASNLNKFQPGWQGYYAFPTAQQLAGLSSRGPFIARLGGNPGHFVIVDAVKAGKVLIRDPAGGVSRVEALSKFTETVSGVVHR